MRTHFFLGLTLALLGTTSALAQPTLTVTNTGQNGNGNLEWLVEIAPDPALFTNTDLGLGGSLAVEMAVEIANTDLLAVTVNNTDWPLDIPGNNPFTSTVTTGVDLDLAGDTVFASLLSNFFTSGTAVELMTIETSGIDCTTLLWGGHTVLGGTPDEYESSLIAQGGQNFTGYVGTAGEPAGDFDADCDVDGADFLEWQKSFGSPYDASDLTDWENNYGTGVPLQAVFSAVPEPSSLFLLLSSSAVLSACGRFRLSHSQGP